MSGTNHSISRMRIMPRADAARRFLDTMAQHDAVLKVLAAGMASRADAATPASAAALRAHAAPVADAAEALAARALAAAEEAAADGTGRSSEGVARAAAGLLVRASRLRRRLDAFEAKARSNRRR
jgi:hypothetical protein